jgi:hypothetical protein
MWVSCGSFDVLMARSDDETGKVGIYLPRHFRPAVLEQFCEGLLID